MVKDVPVIPATEGVDWYQYNTKDLAGWVTKGDPYAQPAAVRDPGLGRDAPAPRSRRSQQAERDG